MKSNQIKKYLILFIVGALLCFSAFFLTMFNNSVFALDSNSDIIIDVEISSYDINNLPNGVVGKSYPVFDYEAVDENGKKIENASVLVYNDSNELVSVNDMRFPTETAGKYKIVYNAINGTVQKTFTLIVTVVEESEYTAPEYIFDSTIVDSCFTGEQVVIRNGSYGGGNGDVVVLKNLLYDGEYDASAVKIENFGSFDYFIPTVSGEYTLEYSIMDITGTKNTKKKVITVTDSSKPIMNIPSIPSLASIGENVLFKNTEAIVYIDGMQIYVPVKIYVDSTDVTLNMSYIPENDGEYTVKYEAVNPFVDSNNVTSYSQVLKVVDLDANVQALVPYITSYFKLDGFDGIWNKGIESSTIGLSERVYVLKANSNNAFASFKTDISTQLLSANIGFDNIIDNSVISFCFVDSVDSDEKFTISFKLNDAKVDELGNKLFDIYFGESFVTTLALEKAVFDFSINCETGILELKYKELTKNINSIISSNTTKQLEITCYDNGKKFTCFESDSCYLTFGAENVENNFIFKLYQLCTQNINGNTSDSGKPIIFTEKGFNTTTNAEYGEVFIVKPVMAFDLFDKDITITATLKDTSGKEIFTSKNIDEIAPFVLNQYGTYNLTYYATDSSGNSRDLKCYIIVVDRESPMISDVSFKTNVGVGETLTLPLATITDNATKNVTNWIYVTCDNYNKIMVYDGKNVTDCEFTFDKAGTYVVTYGAIDDAGNVTVVKYTVECQ